MVKRLKEFVRWQSFFLRVRLSRMICNADFVTMKDATGGREALQRELKLLTGKRYVTEPVTGTDRYRAVPWEDRDKAQWFTGTVTKAS